MTYIENIYLCLALPLLLSLFFIRGRSRRYALFLVIGMTVCLLSAYVSSFFMGYYGADGTTAAIEITPVCEEGMKLLPLLFFYLIFEPAPQELPAAAIALAAGFATFENVCYLTENGAADFRFLLIRGIAAGALHIQLGGTHNYFGKPVEKPTIGDADRPAERADIRRANRLLYTSSLLMMALIVLIAIVR